MKYNRIFHISENGNIESFIPRPSPSEFDNIKGPVVFGISDKLLHNYLLPRDCPRVTYYARPGSTRFDKEYFFQTPAKFVIAIEANWLQVIQQTVLYCYEFDANSFILLDECAGYYISYEQGNPIAVSRIHNPLDELLKRSDTELRVLRTLLDLAEKLKKSSLNFSLIRMKNAKPNENEGLVTK